MDSMKKREDDFEKKYAHDEELRFKITMRAAKLIGTWAAEEMGKSNEEASNYAADFVNLAMKDKEFAEIKAKIRADFDEYEVDISDNVIATECGRFIEEAKNQIRND